MNVTHDSASNANAVRSPILVGCPSARRAHVSSSSGLVDTGVNNTHPRCAYADARRNPHARSADSWGCYGTRDTAFRYAHGLAIDNSIR